MRSGTGVRCGWRPVGLATGRANTSPSISSHRPARMRIAEMPSAMQWWTFISIAHRLPLRPSMTQHSHSGRSRSSRRSNTSATTPNSSASSPGRGTAIRRTWRLMSNAGSSTHCGAPISKGWVRSICMHRRNRSNTLCQKSFELFILGRRAVDDGDSTDRHTDVAVGILSHEKAGIERSELFHESSRRSFSGLHVSIGGECRSEVAAALTCVNNGSRLCGNVVEGSQERDWLAARKSSRAAKVWGARASS